MHMNVATLLFKIIQERQLDVMFAMEEALSKQTKATILEVLNDVKKHEEDKIRLFVMYYLAAPGEIPREDMAEFQNALVKSGCQITVLNFIKQYGQTN